MRILLALLLLVGAFFAGAAWRNTENKQDTATEVVSRNGQQRHSLPTRAASARTALFRLPIGLTTIK